jgi:nitrate/nitrite-specific signal transduction histidine kinase
MSDPGGGDELLARQKEFIAQFFKKGEELAWELIRDNESLRLKAVELEAELAAARAKLVGFNDAMQQKRRYEERFAEVERENHDLASLYVAAYQLHATLDPAAVVRTVVEILVNFVGAKTFAVFVVDEPRARLVAVAAHNVDREVLAQPALGSPGLGEQALAERPSYTEFEPAAPDPRADPPRVVVPLRMGEKSVGALAIWELLAHKGALDSVDYELFNLLAAHAASALEAARLAAGGGGLADLI